MALSVSQQFRVNKIFRQYVQTRRKPSSEFSSFELSTFGRLDGPSIQEFAVNNGFLRVEISSPAGAQV